MAFQVGIGGSKFPHKSEVDEKFKFKYVIYVLTDLKCFMKTMNHRLKVNLNIHTIPTNFII